MIRIKKQRKGRQIIDLTGPKGNAFCLIGIARSLANRLGLDTDEIIDEMEESDYEHLVQTFDKYFGDFVILER
jgi:hypothetical protein